MTRSLSCGVVVTDGVHLLIGHATQSTRWDIPKGQAEAGESPDTAARRELLEETGLHADNEVLTPLGEHRYLPRKDLALFAWQVASMPDPAALMCRTTFRRNGHDFPELDRFACPAWSDALPKLGKSMAEILRHLASSRGWL